MSIDIEQKKKALDAALLQIEKQYGKGAVMKLGDPSVQMNMRWTRRCCRSRNSTGREL